jgi:hypothetical protein
VDPSASPLAGAGQVSLVQPPDDGLTLPAPGDPQPALTGFGSLADGLTDPPGHHGDDLPPAAGSGDQGAWGGVAAGFPSPGDQDPGFPGPAAGDVPPIDDGLDPPPDAIDPPPTWNR